MGDPAFFLQPYPPPPFPAIPLPPASVVAADAMNSTAMDPTGGLRVGVGTFGYGIGISIGILVLITTITLASYYCTRPSTTPQVLPTRGLRPPAPGGNAPPPLPDLELGLDDATLKSYPSLLYSKAKLKNKDSTSTCCSICLADYKDTDMLRLLPDCGHLFHQKCVDAWLRMHPTCPVCRSSPMPSPLPTPLAEVVPLAASRV